MASALLCLEKHVDSCLYNVAAEVFSRGKIRFSMMFLYELSDTHVAKIIRTKAREATA